MWFLVSYSQNCPIVALCIGADSQGDLSFLGIFEINFLSHDADGANVETF